MLLGIILVTFWLFANSNYASNKMETSVENNLSDELLDKNTMEQKGGNSSGNISSYGVLAQESGWVYYSNLNDESKIYRKKIDGSSTKKLNDVMSDYLNICDGWIYYRQVNKCAIVKMKIDGSSEQELYKGVIGDLNYWDGFLYFTQDGTLQKVKNDGTEKQIILQENVQCVTVLDDCIYYTHIDKGNIYRSNLDGSCTQLLFHGETSAMVVDEDWIYFVDEEEYRLCKMKTDGKELTIINNNSPNQINICNDWIYYNSGDGIWRMKKDGTDDKRMKEERIITFSVTENAILYDYEIEQPIRINNQLKQQLQLLE